MKPNLPYLRPTLVFTGLVILFLACDRQQEPVTPFWDGEFFGMKTISGKVVIEPKYQFANIWNDNGYITIRENDKYGALDSYGNVIIEPQFEYLHGFWTGGFAPVLKDTLWGLIDSLGNEVIPYLYKRISPWNPGFIEATNQQGLHGVINVQGDTIVPFIYRDIDHPRNGDSLVFVDQKARYGFLNYHQNRIVIPIKYRGARQFDQNLAWVEDSCYGSRCGEGRGKWGLINRQNQLVIPFIYDTPQYRRKGESLIENGLIRAKAGGKYGCLNIDGDTIIPFKYSRLGRFSYGYAAISTDSTYGYLDSTGKEYMYPHFNEDFPEWDEITKAPSELPDSSFILTYSKYQRSIRDRLTGSGDLREYLRYADSIATSVTYNIYFGDTVSLERGFYIDREILEPWKPNSPILSNVGYDGTVFYDTISIQGVRKAIIPVLVKDSLFLKDHWTLERLLFHNLSALREEPQSYPDLSNITEICASYGLLIGHGNFSEDYATMYGTKWQRFKDKTVYKIIGSESLRKLAWNWIAPYYKQSFETMHPFHQQAYIDLIHHVQEYLNDYDIKEVSAYLKRDERRFAHYDSDGTYNPNRKLCAFVDRLILVHKVITVEEAKDWVNKIAAEMSTWGNPYNYKNTNDSF